MQPEAEFIEFERRLRYGWFHLKLYSVFQDLSWCLIETDYIGLFETRLYIHYIRTLIFTKQYFEVHLKP